MAVFGNPYLVVNTLEIKSMQSWCVNLHAIHINGIDYHLFPYRTDSKQPDQSGMSAHTSYNNHLAIFLHQTQQIVLAYQRHPLLYHLTHRIGGSLLLFMGRIHAHGGSNYYMVDLPVSSNRDHNLLL